GSAPRRIDPNDIVSGETAKSCRELARTHSRTSSELGRSNWTKMVTVRGPRNREVSIRARTAVSSPGARVVFSAAAVTHPQETRTLLMFTGVRVLLVTRK